MDFSAAASEKSLAAVDTRASTAWVKTSMPVSAVTAGGTLAVSTASRMATSGRRLSSTRGYLTSFSGSVMTAKRLTSEPVPLVVGTAMNWQSRMSQALAAKKTMVLAASMGEPPPKAMTASGLNSRMVSTPLVTVAMSGSAFTWSKIRYSAPTLSRTSVI